MALTWILSAPKIKKAWLKDKTAVSELQELQDLLDSRERLVKMYSAEDVSGHLEENFPGESKQRTVPFPKQNIVNRGIKRISLVYKNQPDYDYGEDVTLPPDFSERTRWEFLKETERLTNLLGTLMVRPVVRFDDDEKPYMDYERLWFYIPLFRDNPFVPEAVLYPISPPGTELIANLGVLWQYWDKDQVYIMNSKGEIQPDEQNPNHENPYGTIPWVSVHIRSQTRKYWTIGYGTAIADANDALNTGLMEMRLGVRLNLMGQWYITGTSRPQKEFKMGVYNVPHLPAGVDLMCKAPTADIESAIAEVRNEVEISMQNIGLHVVWGEEGGVPSGESLKVKNFELLENREDDAVKWLVTDENFYEKEQIIREHTEGLKSLPESRSVNFKEIEFPLHPEEKRNRDDWSLDKGTLSVVDIYFRENPDAFSEIEDVDKRRQAVLDLIKRNQAENGQVRIREGESPTGAANIFEKRGQGALAG